MPLGHRDGDTQGGSDLFAPEAKLRADQISEKAALAALRPVLEDPSVLKVVALSGGYTRAEACKRLASNHGVIASFSRALVEGLNHSMSDAEFDAALAKSIDEIYQASTVKA